MKAKLKPCPFCGNETIFYRYDGSRNRHAVKCRDCTANVISDNSKELAFKYWNRRNGK